MCFCGDSECPSCGVAQGTKTDEPHGPPFKPETPKPGGALATLLSRFHVTAKVVGFDYDPAGSSTEYVPEPRDVAIVQAFIERPLTEEDFVFSVGCGPHPTCYSVRGSVIEEIKKQYV